MPLSKLAQIESNQEKDLHSIRRNKRNIDENYTDIGKLFDRIKRLESMVETSLKTKSYRPKSDAKPTPPKKKSNTPDLKMKELDMEKKSAQLELDRSALIGFNEMNADLPQEEKYTWKRVLDKAGDVNIETFDRIVDNKSLDCLLSNATTKAIVNNILVGEGGPMLNIGTNIRKKYWVFLKDGKLTTLSKDFMGGVGSEYLWTKEADLKPSSTKWRMPTKREKDPRRCHVDPETKALWVPDDEKEQAGANPEDDNEEEKKQAVRLLACSLERRILVLIYSSVQHASKFFTAYISLF